MKCPHCGKHINVGALLASERDPDVSRQNGKKGGRPKGSKDAKPRKRRKVE